MNGKRKHLATGSRVNFDITMGEDPIKLLWGAVLRQALQDLQHPTGMDGRGAITWVRSERAEPCSFHWVCETLGFNPEVLRTHVGLAVAA